MIDHWRNTWMGRKLKSLKYLLYKLLAWPWNSTRLWKAQYWPKQVFFLRLPSSNKMFLPWVKRLGIGLSLRILFFEGGEVQNKKNRKFFSLVLLGPLTKERDKRKRIAPLTGGYLQSILFPHQNLWQHNTKGTQHRLDNAFEIVLYLLLANFCLELTSLIWRCLKGAMGKLPLPFQKCHKQKTRSMNKKQTQWHCCSLQYTRAEKLRAK